MSHLQSEAICIRQWDWSETSQTVSLLTPDHGILRALAKGSRRPKSPYSGGLEPLTRGHATAILKPSSDLALLTAWDLAETYPWLRASLHAHNAALYTADLVHHFLHQHDPHPVVYDALLVALRSFHDPDNVAHNLLIFQWKLLDDTGYRPTLTTHAQTPLLGFDPEAGGVVADPGPGRSPRVWRARQATINALRDISQSPAKPADPQSTDRANKLLAAYAAWILGRTPPSAESVFGPLELP